MERIEFGLTQVEIRALQELGLNSGARAIAIYDETGRLLTPNSLPAPINLKRIAIMGLIVACIVLLCFLCTIFIF